VRSTPPGQTVSALMFTPLVPIEVGPLKSQKGGPVGPALPYAELARVAILRIAEAGNGSRRMSTNRKKKNAQRYLDFIFFSRNLDVTGISMRGYYRRN